MSVTFVGVRHHSPACSRLVRDTIRELRPAHVLIEGPADINDRIDELLLGHRLPIAVFTSYRDDDRRHASWSPFCEHSPEWVALTEGREAGAEVRFIDLPAWHPAFAERTNRYADAERRHGDAVERLCTAFAVDNLDALWDHLFEIADRGDRAEELAAYFELVRGEDAASDTDEAREAYMTRWVAAATADAGDRPVVVVTGGFHRPPLRRAAERDAMATGSGPVAWPEVPVFPEGAVGGSYLVPFSFRRLDAFDGYQSGMPSPRYYQRLWEAGPEAAGDEIVVAVAERLRKRRQPVSTADLIAARTQSLGLARLRGNPIPARIDVLDGLVSALVTDALDRPLPWTGRGRLAVGTDPVVVEMVAALSGDVTGRLHADTPHPPLVADVAAALERLDLPDSGAIALELTDERDRERSRVLHRLRVLGLPGIERRSGPVPSGEPTLTESWRRDPSELWLASLIEAGSHGATLDAAAAAVIGDRFTAGGADAAAVATVLFDAALCGLDELGRDLVERAERAVATLADLGALGGLLATALGLWRHDHLLGTAGDPLLGDLVGAATSRALWLVEGIRGGPAPADAERLRAVVAVRDVVRQRPTSCGSTATPWSPRSAAAASDRPPDLRGASVGMAWALGAGADEAAPTEALAAVRASAHVEVLGDLLSGLFAVAREEVLDQEEPSLLGLLDEVLGGFADEAFLLAVPSLRTAFSWFPPRERERIAHGLLDRRGLRGSASSLLRLSASPEVLTAARSLEDRVDALLTREALLSTHRSSAAEATTDRPDDGDEADDE